MMAARAGRFVAVALVACMIGAGSAVVLPGGPAASATAKAPITLALITSLTGPAGPQFTDAPLGFRARIALQNAQGGVNGQKIIPLVIDDQTSPTAVATAVQNAISKGAFGIVSASPLFFLAAKYPNQQGMPVTGGSFDGPEWGQKPYTNMFASDTGSVDPKYPVSTAIGTFLKSHGGTVVASYGYSVSPSSTRSARGTNKSFQHAGGKVGVLDVSIPFGGVDFTTEALYAKQKSVDAVYAGMDNNSNFALAKSLQNAGVKVKSLVFPTGFQPDVIGSPAWQSVQNDYFFSGFHPAQLPNAGTQQMASALQKYQGRSASQFPSFIVYESWLGADLMIKGLQLAGPSPTRANVIKDLRNVKSYNGNGLLPVSINYSTIFGHNLSPTCGWYLRAQPRGFVPTSSQPVCGHDIPGTSTAS
jgi:branched-chain amino acid transport system substrate-binding protein